MFHLILAIQEKGLISKVNSLQSEDNYVNI